MFLSRRHRPRAEGSGSAATEGQQRALVAVAATLRRSGGLAGRNRDLRVNHKGVAGRYNGEDKSRTRREVLVNILDLFIMAFFTGIIALAFLGGLGKVLSALIGLYLAAIVSAVFYRPLATAAGTVFTTMSPFTGDLVMFALLLVFSTLAVSAGLTRTFVLGKIPSRLGAFNNISGGVLGVLVALFSTVLASMIISLGLQVIDRTATLGSSPLLLGLQEQMHGAMLVPIFLKLAPTFVTPLQPWFPKGLPPILTPGA